MTTTPRNYGKTERLKLRGLEEKDAPVIFAYLQEEGVAKFLSSLPKPYLREHASGFVEMMQAGYEAGRPEVFVLARPEDDLLMGVIGYSAPRNLAPEEGLIEIGYWMGKPHWGKGLMTEGLLASLKATQGRSDIKRIEVTTDIDNLASQKVVKKAGFVYLGQITSPVPCHDGTHEVFHWRWPKVE